MDKMTPAEVPLTDDIARRMGYVNLQAMKNYERIKDEVGVNDTCSAKLLLRIVNMEQMLIDVKVHCERLERMLLDTGAMKVG